MFRKLVRITGYLIIAYCIYGVYGYHRAGYFDLPDTPDNAYTITFKNGFRAIVVDPEVSVTWNAGNPDSFRRLATANPDRRYLGLPSEVPSWFENRWSTCQAVTDADELQIRASLPANVAAQIRTARFDAACYIETDNERVPRGLIFSVPKG